MNRHHTVADIRVQHRPVWLSAHTDPDMTSAVELLPRSLLEVEEDKVQLVHRELVARMATVYHKDLAGRTSWDLAHNRAAQVVPRHIDHYNAAPDDHYTVRRGKGRNAEEEAVAGHSRCAEEEARNRMDRVVEEDLFDTHNLPLHRRHVALRHVDTLYSNDLRTRLVSFTEVKLDPA